MSTLKYIKSDLYRYTRKKDTKTLVLNYLTNRSFNYSVWFRLASTNNKLSLIARVVTKDIPGNSTAAGNYAKVLNNNPNLKYIHNRWTDS